MHPYQPGETIDGRWQVRRVLQGGLGRVYITMDLVDHFPLAIKTFQVEQADGAAVQRFRQEASVWLKLGSHPNIVGARNFFQVQDEYWLFLEYVDGGDLSEWIGTPRLDLKTTLNLALQFCDGMIHAQAAGLQAHRDVKSQNCMLTRGGQLKISDFGLAKASWTRDLKIKGGADLPMGITGAGGALGTISHAAPEQMMDAASVDARADIYSFGIMLFEMLTGELPFRGETLNEVVSQHLSAPPPRLPIGPLDTIVQACLAKQPEQRPATFSDLRARLAGVYGELLEAAAPAPPRAADFGVLESEMRAVSMIGLGEPQEALQILGRCVKERPDLRSLWYSLGFAQVQSGLPQEALTSLSKAQSLGEDFRTWIEIAMSHQLLEQYAEAERAYRRSLEMNPEYADTHYALGSLLVALERDQEALTCYRRAVDLEPEKSDLYVGLGMILARTGAVEQAQAAFEQCLRRDATHGGAWRYLGLCRQMQGDLNGALTCTERAAQLDPRHWASLGKLLEQAGGSPEALQICLQAEVDHPEAAMALGQVLLRAGKLHEGLARLEQAQQLGHPEAARMVATLRRGM